MQTSDIAFLNERASRWVWLQTRITYDPHRGREPGDTKRNRRTVTALPYAERADMGGGLCPTQTLNRV